MRKFFYPKKPEQEASRKKPSKKDKEEKKEEEAEKLITKDKDIKGKIAEDFLYNIGFRKDWRPSCQGHD